MKCSSLSIPLAVSLLAACNVGDVSSGGPTKDGGGEVSADAQKPDLNCEPVGTPGKAKHRAGTSCMANGCHDTATSAKKWTLAGTLYKDKAGAAAVVGGTIVFTDANGAEIKLITAADGNFFTEATIAFPIKVKASRCPNTNSMEGDVDMAGGNCNSSGCHGSSDARIYVP